MSHHLDSPASRQDPRLNLTDVYAFDGRIGTVLVLVVNTSLAGDGRTPGFHPEGRYELKVHLDAEEYEELTYRVAFGDRDADGTQELTLSALAGPGARDDAATGLVLASGHTETTIEGTGGLRLWAGAVDDPFYLDLHQLAHIIEGLQAGKPVRLDGWTPSDAASSFTGSQVCAIVLEVPGSDERLRPGRRIGVWGTTKLATDAGGWRQVNRAAVPMMWPLFRARGGDDDSPEYAADTAGHPAQDRERDGAKVAGIITAAARNTGTANPQAYGRVVTERLLPDVLPYTVGTPAAFSFAGFNGRSLADNAPEVMYGLITNAALPTALTSADAAETRQADFPYVVPAGAPRT